MSLLEQAYEPFVLLNKVSSADGYGGMITEWVDGPTISGAITLDSASDVRVAQALGATSVYTLTVRKDVLLDYHDVLRRESDGKLFRLTTDSDDKKTPKTAGLNMRQYSAEAWTL